jgi:hypothetical protein
VWRCEPAELAGLDQKKALRRGWEVHENLQMGPDTEMHQLDVLGKGRVVCRRGRMAEDWDSPVETLQRSEMVSQDGCDSGHKMVCTCSRFCIHSDDQGVGSSARGRLNAVSPPGGGGYECGLEPE